MRFNRILTLVKTNLIFATQPAQLQNYRKKQAKNPAKPVNVAMRTLIQQLMFAVIFGGFFGFENSGNHGWCGCVSLGDAKRRNYAGRRFRLPNM